MACAKSKGAPAGGTSLVLYDLKSQRPTVLVSSADMIHIYSAGISPDGQWIAFQTAPIRPSDPSQEASNEPPKMWVMRRDGSGLRQVTLNGQAISWPALLWAESGRAYYNQPPEVSATWIAEVDAESGQARMIENQWHARRLTSVSRDGRRLLAIRGEGEKAELHLLDLAPQPAMKSLTIEEYAICPQAKGEPFPNDPCALRQSKDKEILGKRQAWRKPEAKVDLAKINEVLSPFGYRLAKGPVAYDLYRGREPVLRALLSVGPVSASQTGKSMLAVARDYADRLFLVRQDRVEPWDESKHAYTLPVLVGDDVVTIEPGADHAQFAIRRGEKTVYTFTPPLSPTTNPIKGLWSWEGHWILEIGNLAGSGHVVVDGEELNKQLGYEEIFGWQLVGGQPFYFFKQGGRIHMSYAGQVLPPEYEVVPHYYCCSPAAFNDQGNDKMVWFYGRRDGAWYYVEAGLFE